MLKNNPRMNMKASMTTLSQTSGLGRMISCAYSETYTGYNPFVAVCAF